MDIKMSSVPRLNGAATFRGYQYPGQWIVFDRDRTNRVRCAEDIGFPGQNRWCSGRGLWVGKDWNWCCAEGHAQ